MAMRSRRHRASLDRIAADVAAKGRENLRKERARQDVLKRLQASTPEELIEIAQRRAVEEYKTNANRIKRLQMQARASGKSMAAKQAMIAAGIDPMSADQALSAGELRGDELKSVRQQISEKPGFQGKKNVYTCEECGFSYVTVDIDEGTTPFMSMCQNDGCKALAKSSFYRVPSDLVATHEWYRPADVSGESPMTQEHVRMGGLLLREIRE